VSRPGRTAAFDRAVLVGVLGTGIGLVLGRPDLVLLGAPLLVGAWLALASRTAQPRAPQVDVEWSRLVEQDVATGVRVRVEADGAALVTVRLCAGAVVPHAVTATLGPATGDFGVRRVLVTSVRVPGRGRVVLARPDVVALGADGLLRVGPVVGTEAGTLALPAYDVVPPLPLPARPAGIVGGHRTRRPGDGSDLLDVREFRPGDRLHRIDWRVSARRERLHVRRTTVDADADVLLVLDSRVDVGHAAEQWAQPAERDLGGRGRAGSSLDLAVRAATSLAVAHLRHGDRVALVDLADRRAWVPAGSGRRQLLRLRVRLAGARGAAESTTVVRRPDRVVSGSVVIVLSSFLDAPAADVAADAARRGAFVLAVDCLPDPVVAAPQVPRLADALDAVLGEHAARLDGLRHQGVVVLRWDPALVAVQVARWSRRHRERTR
jgi:uncharacterized protein (DUF58 family)